MFITAHDAISTLAGLRPGDTLLVHGAAGGVGSAAVQIGVASGAIVIGVSRHAEGRKAIESWGATAIDADGWVESVLELTGGRGADVVLHMANTPRSFVEGIEMLKRGGMMLEMGNFADTGEVSLNVHRHICSKNIRLIGITNHPSTGYGPALTLLERYADRYPLEDMVSHEYALADVDAAMRMSMSTESLKVAMVPSLG